MKTLKKSYLGIGVWTIVYTLLCSLCSLLPLNTNQMVIVILNLTTIAVAALAFVIYLNERIFWYNGISYKQAIEAGAERRKLYAFRIFVIFAKFAILFLIYSILALIFNLHIVISTMVLTIGLIIAALKTTKIKL